MISCALAAFSGLSAQNDTTFVANGNPIIKYKYTADPGAMVHDGKVYICLLYTSDAADEL